MAPKSEQVSRISSGISPWKFLLACSDLALHQSSMQTDLTNGRCMKQLSHLTKDLASPVEHIQGQATTIFFV